ncbi:Chloroplastic group IIA intron splicing facilitator CRS1, chloroplastic-like protein [Drosera capensis]
MSATLLQSLNPFFNSPLKKPKPLNCLSTTTASISINGVHYNNIEPNKPRNPDSQKQNQNDHIPTIKMPTAPWMQGPLLLPPNEVLDFSKSQTKKPNPTNRNGKNPDRVLTEKVSGARGRQAMKKIIHGMKKLEEKGNLKTTHFDSGGFGGELDLDEGIERMRRLPWVKEEMAGSRGRWVKPKVVTAAEMCLDGDLLERLRREAKKMRVWVKVKKLGVTEGVVDEVHSIWRNNELVMLKFDVPLCRNMERAQDIVELKTGGLVVWSKKDSLVAYRGCNYKPSSRFRKIHPKYSAAGQASSLTTYYQKGLETNSTITNGLGKSGSVEESLLSQNLLDDNVVHMGTERTLYQSETDRLLDGLGPRFVDWWYPKPLPVDADLLPEVVPGFRPPLRISPPGVRAKLSDVELTYFRKLARSLPTHFVLGRNTKLQGLAVAILKLWHKSIIAKIAIKWGVPNTNNELMASELKARGVLLLRNKFILILYRGKDFIPGEVADLVLSREAELKKWYLHEENSRLKGYETSNLDVEASSNMFTTGTLLEFHRIQAMSGDSIKRCMNEEVQLQVEKARIEKEMRSQEYKLAILKKKIEKSEKGLFKLNVAEQPSEEEPDLEWITNEERECFRKIARKMHRVLVLGRRGVFDGVIEGLHQHWKHRELVKVITMQRSFAQVIYTANILERESGGILISVDKQKEGHAIIIYRGKNYRRPRHVGDNLLSKRKALLRSLELQRVGCLRFIAYQREKAISELNAKLADLQVKGKGTFLENDYEDLKKQRLAVVNHGEC